MKRWQGWAMMFAAALLVGGPLAADDKDKSGSGEARQAGHHKTHFEQCAKACSDCQRICDSCANHCAHMITEGKKEHSQTLRTCQDCATFCAAAAQIVSRQGPFADAICQSCAEACARCGKACERFPDDEHMKQCAEECRRCEKACRDMLGHLGGGGAAPK